MKRNRAIQIFLFAVVCILCISFLSSATGDTPVLYRNDTKYSIEEYPAEKQDGTVYVPINFFIGFKSIQYEYSNNPAGFYFRNAETGRYFSFSSTSSFIVVDGALTDVSFPIMNSTIYMPLEYCTKILSLGVEYANSGDVQRIRVTDGTHKLTFDELIELYDPTETPDQPIVTDPSIVEPGIPSVTEPDTPTPKDRYLYITFDQCGGEYTEQIIALLEKNNIKATFYFDSEGIKNDPKSVIRAFVSGHSIGITAETTKELKCTNDVLYEVLHSYTRIAQLKNSVTATEYGKLAKSGYLTSIPHIDSNDWQSTGAKNTARGIYNKTFERQVSIIRIAADEKSTDITKQLLYYISGDEYVTALPISPTAVTNTEVSNGN